VRATAAGPTFGRIRREVFVRAVGRIFKRGFGWWSLLWSLAYALLFAVAAGIPHMPALVLLVLGGLALLCGGAGAFILREVRAAELADSRRRRVRALTDLARRQGGTVTIADVIASADLSRDEAREGLRDCENAGLADLDSDERGVLVWHFRALQRPELPPRRLPWLEDLRHDPALDSPRHDP
jgi:hypothetical protein